MIPIDAIMLNSDLETCLNHLLWLQDYKMYGEESYVFRDKKILEELYLDKCAINDPKTMYEALLYANSAGVLGKSVGKLLECRHIPDISAYRNFDDVAGSDNTELFAVINQFGLLSPLYDDGGILDYWDYFKGAYERISKTEINLKEISLNCPSTSGIFFSDLVADAHMLLAVTYNHRGYGYSQAYVSDKDKMDLIQFKKFSNVGYKALYTFLLLPKEPFYFKYYCTNTTGGTTSGTGGTVRFVYT